MTAAIRTILARARTDDQDRLVEAEEPLAGLHLRCRYPGTPDARRSVGAWLDGVRVRETFGCTLEELQELVPVPLKAAAAA